MPGDQKSLLGASEVAQIRVPAYKVLATMSESGGKKRAAKVGAHHPPRLKNNSYYPDSGYRELSGRRGLKRENPP